MTSLLTVDDPVLLDFAEEVGDSGPVAIAGNRTRWALGGASADDTRLLKAPAGIVEYIPEEMTVRVRVGLSVDDFHAALAEQGQRTALPERGGTVGGALAVGENDLRVLGRGRIRQALLQIRYVSAEGRMVSGGGPTVKNVTGFDIPRLMVGSLGTLGCFVEAIIRTNPIPAVSAWLVSPDVDPFVVADAVLRPSVILWDGEQTWVQLEGHDVDVAAERRALERIGSFAETNGPPELPKYRWSLSPSGLHTLDTAATGSFVASVGVGTMWASNPASKRALDPSVRVVAQRMKAEFDPAARLNPGRSVSR